MDGESKLEGGKTIPRSVGNMPRSGLSSRNDLRHRILGDVPCEIASMPRQLRVENMFK